MNQCVIVRSNRLNAFPREISSNVVVEGMFRKTTLIGTMFLELLLHLKVYIPSYFYNPRLKMLKTNVIIVFDGHTRKPFLKWLDKNNPGTRLIYWCWNSVEEITRTFDVNNIPYRYEKWSYSRYDCDKYQMNYNTTFFWKSYNSAVNNDDTEYDVYFIGKDKGRLDYLLNLRAQLNEKGIKCLFQVTGTHPWNKNKNYCKKIPYNQVMENINKSKAILDLKVNNTSGTTLRPIEAAFFHKKLITNDSEVVNLHFYKENNILILNSKTTEEIVAFLEKPLQPVDNVDLEYYYIDNWIKRFSEEKS